MTRISIWLIVLLMFTSTVEAQPSLISDSLFVPSIGKTKQVYVLLPDRYDSSIKYPVLYLLHGYGGDHANWSQRTRIAEYLRDVPLLVVMPAADNSWYINAVARPNADYEKYIMTDLPMYIEQQYSVDRARQAIAGLSMGGYGATMLAMKYPNRFRFSASLSGALTFPRFLGDTVLQPLSGAIKKNLEEMYGPPGSVARAANDPFLLFRNVAPDSLLYFYFVIGTNDGFKGFLPATRMLTDSLRSARIPYEYHEAPGRHDWKFWDREIRPVLVKMRECMKF